MIATLITVFVLLGLLKTVEVAMEQNLRNQMRDEMTQVVQSQMDSFRSASFSMISTCSTTPGNSTCSQGFFSYNPIAVQSKLRGVNKTYTVFRTTKVSSDGPVDLGVRVRSWPYRNMSTSWEMHTVRAQ